MTDRELLELAARAAGLKARWFPEHAPGLKLFGVSTPWNPLADDGDALRLAVALNLNLFSVSGTAYAMPPEDDEEGRASPYVDGQSDAALDLACLISARGKACPPKKPTRRKAGPAWTA